MKIAHFCEFADKKCGVFRAALELAKRQKKKGHDVKIFTTYFMKDYSKNYNLSECIEGIECKRIFAMKIGGEALNRWDYKSENFSSFDELWSHGYRKHHNIFLYRYPSLFKEKCRKVLVTHAPWGSHSLLRTLAIKWVDWAFGDDIKQNFDIYHIARWEKEHTIFPKNFKLIDIPLRKEFLTLPRKTKQENKILFVGNKKKIQPFLNHNPKINVTVVTDCFDVNELIKLYDSHKYFLAISKREGLPTTLREAKARGCITIATINNGSIEVGADYFFEYGEWNELATFIKEKLSEKPFT